MRVTIKDVSREASVSIATVSNVLNSPDRVAPETRERVLAVIDALGYVPSRAAQALQQQRTFTIGYRMPTVSEGFALDTFLHRMAERAGEAGLDIVLFTPKAGQTEVDAYREMILRGAVDGFVLSGTEHEDPRISYLLEVGIPFVTFGRTDVDDQHPWVDVDGRSGLVDAVNHLLDTGRRDIGFIGWPEGSQVGDMRARGYLDAMHGAGLDPSGDRVVRVLNRFEDGRTAAAQLLDAGVSAIACVQDTLALGAMQAVRDRGLTIGPDVAIVGFDDTPSAAATYPALSSVQQPMGEVGASVIELLLARFEGTEPAPNSALATPRLVIRASSAALALGATE